MVRSRRLIEHSLVLFSFIALAPAALGGEVSGDQWGRWTLDESPYLLVGDVYVPPGQVLTIEAGVVVRALGHYRITVDQALFLALGTEASPILFTAENTTEGWRGITLDSADDNTVISHCIIEYAKDTGQMGKLFAGGLLIVSCSPTVSLSVFRFNSSHNDNCNSRGGGIGAYESSAVIVDNLFFANDADNGGAISAGHWGSPLISGNIIMGNTGVCGAGGIHLAVQRKVTLRA